MKQDAAHHSIFKTSDVILLVVFVGGTLVEYFFFWDFKFQAPFYISIVPGVVITLLGFRLIVSSKSALDKEKQPSQPNRPTTVIIITGIYGKTRNPTYLGCTLLVLGLGITFNFIAWIVGAFIAGILMHFLLILPEEKYLMAKFPTEYAEYTKKVRRWL